MLGWIRRSFTPGTVALAGAASLSAPKPAMQRQRERRRRASARAPDASLRRATASPARRRSRSRGRSARAGRQARRFAPSVRLAPSAMPMSFQGKPVSTSPRAHSLDAQSEGEREDPQGPDDQRSRASANPRAGKTARPAGSARTPSGQRPGELVGVDQERPRRPTKARRRK